MAVIDLKQFYPTFFAESFAGLDAMEGELLRLEADNDALDAVHAIFRAAHSIKGASGSFGFGDIADFTHALEGFLDAMRNGERAATPDIIDLLLQCVDCLRGMLKRAQAGENPADACARQLSTRLHTARPTAPAPAAAVSRARVARRTIKVRLAPRAHFFRSGNDPLRLFRALAGLGALSAQADVRALPALEGMDPEQSYLSWTLRLETDAPRKEVEEVFEWIDGDADLAIEEDAVVTGSGSSSEAATQAYSSLQVSTDKVDQLVNLVGELVITQTMLKQAAATFEVASAQRLHEGLAQLDRYMRELQDSVMAIRMLPVSFMFSRFARLTRDVAQQLGKKVSLKISGETSELDKTVIERMIDPLTHLVRNCLDHGIEAPTERRALGKPETGTLGLHAEHKGGHIVIRVTDDGRGIDRTRVRAKAIERGLIKEAEVLSERDMDELIFLPGFSTAETVSSVSGRGVGMDVVRRNVVGLGGSIDIESTPGVGTTFVIRLPLTLAILDGMTVALGAERFVIPLTFIVETLQLTPDLTRTVGSHARVVDVRGEYIPLVSLGAILRLPRDHADDGGMVVLLEAEGRKIALGVDVVLGQDQVVIKSLEANYRRVTHVAGATIMGDGRVALILDANSLVRLVQN